ncbi:MAG: hypothetical protein KDC95_03440 [Planctomycetes bacterium]|nr:hypothetical protein [Planctomycetota bacterium]
MRTMHEIVDRFGYPQKAAASGGGQSDVCWRYWVTGENPEASPSLTFNFLGGRVMWTTAHSPR